MAIRPGLKSGIRKDLVQFLDNQTPIYLPDMVELWGKKIGFSQTASSRLQQRVNQDESDHFQQSQETATPTQEHEPISQQPPKTHEPSHEESPIIHESSQEQPRILPIQLKFRNHLNLLH